MIVPLPTHAERASPVDPTRDLAKPGADAESFAAILASSRPVSPMPDIEGSAASQLSAKDQPSTAHSSIDAPKLAGEPKQATAQSQLARVLADQPRTLPTIPPKQPASVARIFNEDGLFGFSIKADATNVIATEPVAAITANLSIASGFPPAEPLGRPATLQTTLLPFRPVLPTPISDVPVDTVGLNNPPDPRSIASPLHVRAPTKPALAESDDAAAVAAGPMKTAQARTTPVQAAPVKPVLAQAAPVPTIREHPAMAPDRQIFAPRPLPTTPLAPGRHIPQIETGPLVAPAKPLRATLEGSTATESARPVTRHLSTREPMGQLPVQVALRELEHGMHIAVRVEGLDPAEQARLHDDINALLARHGLSARSIRIVAPGRGKSQERMK